MSPPTPPDGRPGGAHARRAEERTTAPQVAYPVPWYAAERNATWLVPSRLLASIFIAEPSDSWAVSASIDGQPVPVHRS